MEPKNVNEDTLQNHPNTNETNQLLLEEALFNSDTSGTQIISPFIVHTGNGNYQTVILNDNYALIENEKLVNGQQYPMIQVRSTEELVEGHLQDKDFLQELSEARSHAIQLHLSKTSENSGSGSVNLIDRDNRTYSRFKRYQELESSRLTSEANLTSHYNVVPSKPGDIYHISATNESYNDISSQPSSVYSTPVRCESYNIISQPNEIYSISETSEGCHITSHPTAIYSIPVTNETCHITSQPSEVYSVPVSQPLTSETYSMASLNPQTYFTDEPFNSFLQFNPEYPIMEQPIVTIAKTPPGVTFSQVIKYVSSNGDSEVSSLRRGHPNVLLKKQSISKEESFTKSPSEEPARTVGFQEAVSEEDDDSVKISEAIQSDQHTREVVPHSLESTEESSQDGSDSVEEYVVTLEDSQGSVQYVQNEENELECQDMKINENQFVENCFEGSNDIQVESVCQNVNEETTKLSESNDENKEFHQFRENHIFEEQCKENLKIQRIEGETKNQRGGEEIEINKHVQPYSCDQNSYQETLSIQEEENQSKENIKHVDEGICQGSKEQYISYEINIEDKEASIENGKNVYKYQLPDFTKKEIEFQVEPQIELQPYFQDNSDEFPVQEVDKNVDQDQVQVAVPIQQNIEDIRENVNTNQEVNQMQFGSYSPHHREEIQENVSENEDHMEIEEDLNMNQEQTTAEIEENVCKNEKIGQMQDEHYFEHNSKQSEDPNTQFKDIGEEKLLLAQELEENVNQKQENQEQLKHCIHDYTQQESDYQAVPSQKQEDLLGQKIEVSLDVSPELEYQIQEEPYHDHYREKQEETTSQSAESIDQEVSDEAVTQIEIKLQEITFPTQTIEEQVDQDTEIKGSEENKEQNENFIDQSLFVPEIEETIQVDQDPQVEDSEHNIEQNETVPEIEETMDLTEKLEIQNEPQAIQGEESIEGTLSVQKSEKTVDLTEEVESQNEQCMAKQVASVEIFENESNEDTKLEETVDLTEEIVLQHDPHNEKYISQIVEVTHSQESDENILPIEKVERTMYHQEDTEESHLPEVATHHEEVTDEETVSHQELEQNVEIIESKESDEKTLPTEKVKRTIYHQEDTKESNLPEVVPHHEEVTNQDTVSHQGLEQKVEITQSIESDKNTFAEKVEDIEESNLPEVVTPHEEVTYEDTVSSKELEQNGEIPLSKESDENTLLIEKVERTLYHQEDTEESNLLEVVNPHEEVTDEDTVSSKELEQNVEITQSEESDENTLPTEKVERIMYHQENTEESNLTEVVVTHHEEVTEDTLSHQEMEENVYQCQNIEDNSQMTPTDDDSQNEEVFEFPDEINIQSEVTCGEELPIQNIEGSLNDTVEIFNETFFESSSQVCIDENVMQTEEMQEIRTGNSEPLLERGEETQEHQIKESGIITSEENVVFEVFIHEGEVVLDLQEQNDDIQNALIGALEVTKDIKAQILINSGIVSEAHDISHATEIYSIEEIAYQRSANEGNLLVDENPTLRVNSGKEVVLNEEWEETTVESEAQNEDINQKPEVTTRKRRGRPKKIPKIDVNLVTEPSLKQTEDTRQKRVHVKRSSKKDTENVVQELDNVALNNLKEQHASTAGMVDQKSITVKRKSRRRPPKEKLLNKEQKVLENQNTESIFRVFLKKPLKAIKTEPNIEDAGIVKCNEMITVDTTVVNVELPKKGRGRPKKDSSKQKHLQATNSSTEHTFFEDVSDDEVIFKKKPNLSRQTPVQEPLLPNVTSSAAKRSRVQQIRVNPETFKRAILKKIKQELDEEPTEKIRKPSNIKKEPEEILSSESSSTVSPGDLLKSWLLEEVNKPKTLRLRSGRKTAQPCPEEVAAENREESIVEQAGRREEENGIVEITAEDILGSEDCQTDVTEKSVEKSTKNVVKLRKERKRKAGSVLSGEETFKKRRKVHEKTTLSQEIDEFLEETEKKELELKNTLNKVEKQLKEWITKEPTQVQRTPNISKTMLKESVTDTQTKSQAQRKTVFKRRSATSVIGFSKIPLKKRMRPPNIASAAAKKNIRTKSNDTVFTLPENEVNQTSNTTTVVGVKVAARNADDVVQVDDDSDNDSRKEWLPEDYAEYKYKYTMQQWTKKRTTSQCKICLQVFPTYYLLQKHRTVHDNVKPYECNQCDQRFAEVVEWQAHIRLHKGKPPYLCRKCGTGFMTKGDFDGHQPLHILKKEPPKPKRFHCEVCSKEFNKLCDMDRHLRVHTGEKPAVCNVCNKGFQQAHNLSKHLLTHLNVKPFICEICNKKFGRIDVLNRHLLTHSMEKPYKCEYCPKGFIRPSQYNKHVNKMHSDLMDERPSRIEES